MFKKDFKRPGGFKGGQGGGRPGPRDFGDRGGDRERPRLYPAVCAQCGKNCEVPFRPDGQKPVYCRDCFGRPREEGAGSFRQGPARYDAPAQPRAENGDMTALRRQVDALNTKIDNVLRLMQAAQLRAEPAPAPAEEAPVKEKSPAAMKTAMQETIRKNLVKKRAAKKAAKK